MNFFTRWKFTTLLTVLLSVFTARFATVGRPESALVVDLFAAVFVTTALLSICKEHRFRAVALVLGLPGIAFLVGSHAYPFDISPHMYLVGRMFTSLFFAFLVTMIVRAVLTERRVTPDTIVGAFCGYLLLGIIWTELYCAVETINPGAFLVPAQDAARMTDPDHRRRSLEYFSFVTLSTVGFGDVTPVAPAARGLAVIEAICGQFYLAVLVAGLVSIRASVVLSTGQKDP